MPNTRVWEVRHEAEWVLHGRRPDGLVCVCGGGRQRAAFARSQRVSREADGDVLGPVKAGEVRPTFAYHGIASEIVTP